MDIFIDFETQSEVNLKKAGLYKYVTGAFFRPVCMAYAFDNESVQLWTYGQDFPLTKEIVTGNSLVSFNAEFEYQVLKSKFWEFEGYDFSWLTIDHFIDVQAVGRSFGFPSNLENLAKSLNVHHKKDARGTTLINQLCIIKPPKYIVPTYESSPSKFQDLYEYCKQDIRTTRSCYDMFLKKDLSEYERRIFAHMIEQNENGLPIDINSVKTIRDVLNQFVEKCNNRLYELTNGQITAGTQVKRITEYINRRFSEVAEISAGTVDYILSNNKLDDHCRQILKIRQYTSRSSTAKFQRLLDMMGLDKRIRGNLKYYGGHTGRFAGVGFQMHNLPRAQHKNPDEVLKDFTDLSLKDIADKYGNIGQAASRLIRPMIKAPKDKLLCVADYVSIENVVLHWLAHDISTTKDFEQGLDQYKVYASRRFNVKYDDVNDSQRTYAKPCVLGLGYGGGSAALQRVASGYGLELSTRAAEKDKQFYRSTYPMIPELWYKTHSAMIKAIKDETIIDLQTGSTTLRFIKRGTYAFIVLPSGRFLCYPAPLLVYDRYYDNLCFTYMGEDSYTKKWRRLGDPNNGDMGIHGGRLVENIVQALARDLLVHGGLIAKSAGYKLLGSVHDEWIAEVDETVTSNSLKQFCQIICERQKWAKDIPLRAEGYLAKRYRKD